MGRGGPKPTTLPLSWLCPALVSWSAGWDQSGSSGRYLEAVGGRQAALLPELEGMLQLLRGAPGEGTGLAQAAEQGQTG